MEGVAGPNDRAGAKACGGKPVGRVTEIGDSAGPSAIVCLSVMRLLRTVINDREHGE
jgi:hypothetical protein